MILLVGNVAIWPNFFVDRYAIIARLNLMVNLQICSHTIFIYNYV